MRHTADDCIKQGVFEDGLFNDFIHCLRLTRVAMAMTSKRDLYCLCPTVHLHPLFHYIFTVDTIDVYIYTN